MSLFFLNPFSLTIFCAAIFALVFRELSEFSKITKYGIPFVSITIALALWLAIYPDPMIYVILYGFFGILITIAEMLKQWRSGRNSA